MCTTMGLKTELVYMYKSKKRVVYIRSDNRKNADESLRKKVKNPSRFELVKVN